MSKHYVRRSASHARTASWVAHRASSLKPHASSLRPGYTLLEVILALGLAVLVIMLIGMAIDSHVTINARGRTKVEQAQLARAVLRLIADDLRSTVHYAPLDFSSVASLNLDADVGEQNENLSGQNQQSGGAGNQGNGAGQGGTGQTGTGQSGAGQGGQTTGGGNQSSGNQQGGNTGNTSSGGGQTGGAAAGGAGAGSNGSGTGSATAAAGDAAADVPVDVPGVYGTATEIEIDISRLPRVDEYERMVQGGTGGIADIPSDIKTVGYYVAGSGTTSSAASSAGGNLAGGEEGGLMRRSLDRAITQFAYNNGGGGGLGGGQSLAPEVTEIVFEYFDGLDWLPSWDSAEMGAPPVAVAVSIAIRSPQSHSIAERAWTSVAGGGAESEVAIYRQVVYLPASEAASAEAAGNELDSGMTDGAAAEGAMP